MANNLCVWFQIPVKDMARAKKFYKAVLKLKLTNEKMGDMLMAMFPMEGFDNGGALVMGKGESPAKSGAIVYLTGGDDLAAPLSRVKKAGGKVTVPKTAIGGGMGFFALFRDTEGNRVGLWSPN